MGERLDRRWDAFDAYLFDIDGTLLECKDAVHYFAFCNALSRIAGRPMNLDGVTAHGNTDNGIVRDALIHAGIPEAQWRPALPQARAAITEFVKARATEICADLLPGVTRVLEHLRARGAALGVATGNLQAIGQLKLGRCGLLDRFEFAGYSDEFEYRADVFADALRQARALKGETAAVCVVGDTPSDVRAAHENHLNVIAVATGVYSRAELLASGPSLCVASLEELLTLREP